jgi:peptidoglycan/LPS O-acetylase OafA/YrhL
VTASQAVEQAKPASGGWRSFFALDLLDNRHASLHGLRVLAIVSVLQFHVTAIYTQEAGIKVDPRWAESSMTIFFGMDLFFFLSGFLIGAILLRSIELEKKQNVRRFYLRRVFRTFPSYYVVLTFLALAFSLTATQHKNLL